MMPCKLIILAFLGLAILLTASRQNFQDRSAEPNNRPVWILSWSGTELVALNTIENSSEYIDSTDIPAEYTPLFFEKTPVNSANFDMLITIPGIGPKIAERILLQKNNLGYITTASELLAIKGIGEKKLLALQEHLSFE